MKNKRYFLSKKIVLYILIVGNLKVTNVTKIARKTKTTFSNALIITNHLQNLDVIKAPKIGRARRIELTEKGNEIYKCLKEISNIVRLCDSHEKIKYKS